MKGGGFSLAQTALVARRELRERGRSKLFVIGTAIVLLAVAAGVVVPVLLRGHRAHLRVGVVGALPAAELRLIAGSGSSLGATVQVLAERSEQAAVAGVRAGRLDLAVLGGTSILVAHSETAGSISASARLVSLLSLELGEQRQLYAAGIPPAAAARLASPAPLPVRSLAPSARNGTARSTTYWGVILIFVLLLQYSAWVMLGVVEEKSSRVMEVLLATIRPVELLAGKVAGIGLLALVQAAALVAVALGLAAALGSDLVSGAATRELLAVLVWMLLGYVFYCWVFAAAGSLAERQEHIQTLAFPLQLPVYFGYLVALLGISSSSPSLLLKVLAYLPPTAPFAMPVLVEQSAVTWWGFALSCAASLAATALVVRGAVVVFRRAVLRTGRRVRLREVLARA